MNDHDEAHDKVYLAIQSPDVNSYAAHFWTAKIAANGNSITIQHPKLETFLMTKAEDFDSALCTLDGESGEENKALSTEVFSHIVKVTNTAPFKESIPVWGVDHEDLEAPMTQTSILFPPGFTVNNSSFNLEGKFSDKFSLVTRYASVNDIVDDKEFEAMCDERNMGETYLEEIHKARSEQHVALWIVFTMAKDKTKKTLTLKKKTPPRKKQGAFSIKRG